nr:MAG TPA: hypothetical protein [Bacteriophage sp.]
MIYFAFTYSYKTFTTAIILHTTDTILPILNNISIIFSTPFLVL